MSDTPPVSPTPPTPAALPPPSRGRVLFTRLATWFISAAVVIVLLVRVYDFFVLPGCDDDKVSSALYDIFTKTGAKVAAITGLKPTSDASSPRTCEGHVDAGTEQATFQYEVSWNGWSPQAKVTKVDVDKPAN